MKVLDLKDGKVIVSAEVLGIPEFGALYKRDKSQGKATALADISYVYYLVDPNSPYSNYTEDRRLEMLGQDLYKNPKHLPDKEVKEAIKKYKALIDTPLLRLLRAVESKVDELATFLSTTAVTEENLKLILDVLKNATPVVTVAGNTRREAEKEFKVRGQVRGKIEVGDYER